jgi:hypothetical protein
MSRQEKKRLRKQRAEAQKSQKYKLHMRRELAVANAAFAAGNVGGEGGGEEMDEDGRGEESDDEDEWDEHGVLGGCDEDDDDVGECGGGGPPPSGRVQEAVLA